MDREILDTFDAIVKNMEYISKNLLSLAQDVRALKDRIITLEQDQSKPGVRGGRL